MKKTSLYSWEIFGFFLSLPSFGQLKKLKPNGPSLSSVAVRSLWALRPIKTFTKMSLRHFGRKPRQRSGRGETNRFFACLPDRFFRLLPWAKLCDKGTTSCEVVAMFGQMRCPLGVSWGGQLKETDTERMCGAQTFNWNQLLEWMEIWVDTGAEILKNADNQGHFRPWEIRSLNGTRFFSSRLISCEISVPFGDKFQFILENMKRWECISSRIINTL